MPKHVVFAEYIIWLLLCIELDSKNHSLLTTLKNKYVCRSSVLIGCFIAVVSKLANRKARTDVSLYTALSESIGVLHISKAKG